MTGLDPFSDLFATRDSSLALAVAALARIADDQGRATFSDLAVAYREEFLKLRAHAKGEVQDTGSLSVDDARAYLATSVLPRLAMLTVLVLPVGALWGEAPVAFAPDVLASLPADRAVAEQHFLALAEETVAPSESVSAEHPHLGGDERGRRLESLLDELAIKHLRKQKAYQLSGGERRRLEITRALVTEPKFLLLDEPFAGVDPIAVNDIQTIVAGLRHRGIGVLITDHNVEQTLDIVDRAYIMFEGRVQVAGTVRQLVFDDRVASRYLGPTLTTRLRARLSPAA